MKWVKENYPDLIARIARRFNLEKIKHLFDPETKRLELTMKIRRRQVRLVCELMVYVNIYVEILPKNISTEIPEKIVLGFEEIFKEKRICGYLDKMSNKEIAELGLPGQLAFFAAWGDVNNLRLK